MPEELVREPLEKRSLSLTPSQWNWLEQQGIAHQTYSQSAEVRRLIQQERSEKEALAAA